MMDKKAIGITLGILAVVAAVYARCLQFDFLSWDDDLNVTANRLLQAGPWWRFWQAPFQGLYIPPVYSLWSLLAWAEQPLNPALFHGVNLLLHAANTGLVLLLARSVLPQGTRTAGAAFVALLFALHPLQVEAVAWVTGCRDLLSAFWLLLATLLYRRAGANRWRLSGAWLAYIAALLCKPSAVALPAALMALEVGSGETPWRHSLRRLAAWFILVPPVVYLTQRMQAEGVDAALAGLHFGQRLVLALDSFGFYIAKAVVPWPLAIDYGHAPERVLGTAALAVDLGVLAVALLVLWLARAVVKKAGFGWLLWSAMLMLPTSGLVVFSYMHTSTVADHYLYTPLAGFSLALAFAFSQAARRVQTSLATAALGAAAVLASLRLPVWRSDETLYPAMIAGPAPSFAGLIGMTAMALRAKRYDEALDYVNRAQQLEPRNVAALADKGLALARLERYDELLADLGTKLPDRDLILKYPLSAPDMATLLMTIAFAQIKKGQVEYSLPTICRARFADAQNPDVVSFLPLVAAQLGKNADDPELCPAEYRR